MVSKKNTAPAKAKKQEYSRYRRVQTFFSSWKHRYDSFIARRPHRSFVRTRRRDYVRSLQLPGYVAFTFHVLQTLHAHKGIFMRLVLVYGFVLFALGGVTSQSTYSDISSLLSESKDTLAENGLNTLGQAGLLLLSTYATGPGALSPDQQLYLGFFLLMVWLTTVWLLREFLNKRTPILRDGLYNAGAPVMSSMALCFVLLLQLLPIGIMAITYGALTSVGLATAGFGAMLFWLFTAAVVALCLYWATSTFIALVVVTLPGMYPLKALKVSSDLVIGRRLRILYRLLWVQLLILVAWAIIMIPLIMIDGWLKTVWGFYENIPVVPVVAALISAASTVVFAGYVYLLYRKVVDDNAAPA